MATFNKFVKGEFELLASGEYDDEFDIVGNVVSARVDKPKVTVIDENKNEIEAPFEEDDMKTILQALENHKNLQVRIAGFGRFSADGDLRRVEKLDLLEIVGEELSVDLQTVPIWQQLIKIADGMTEAARALLPHDAASRIDHYLYDSNR